MQTLRILKFNYLIFFFILMFSPCITGKTYAERFFQKHSTWYEKIPSNMGTHPDSALVVGRLGADPAQNSGLPKIALNSDKWSIPIFQAQVTDPLINIGFLTWAWNTSGTGLYQASGDCAIAQGWVDNVRAGTNFRGATGNWSVPEPVTDGSCVIISPDGLTCLEFNQFRNPYMGDTTAKVAQHDLTDDGIFDRNIGGNTWVCGTKGGVRIRAGATPFLHGLATYDEVAVRLFGHFSTLEKPKS